MYLWHKMRCSGPVKMKKKEFNHLLAKFSLHSKGGATLRQRLKLRGKSIPAFIKGFWTCPQRLANSIHEVSCRTCFNSQLPSVFYGDIYERCRYMLCFRFNGAHTQQMKGKATMGKMMEDWRRKLQAVNTGNTSFTWGHNNSFGAIVIALWCFVNH